MLIKQTKYRHFVLISSLTLWYHCKKGSFVDLGINSLKQSLTRAVWVTIQTLIKIEVIKLFILNINPFNRQRNVFIYRENFT